MPPFISACPSSVAAADNIDKCHHLLHPVLYLLPSSINSLTIRLTREIYDIATIYCTLLLSSSHTLNNTADKRDRCYHSLLSVLYFFYYTGIHKEVCTFVYVISGLHI